MLQQENHKIMLQDNKAQTRLIILFKYYLNCNNYNELTLRIYITDIVS